ncbi:hypothetical protein BDV26DRAFT_265924, partial [Aspergillus bertholletiae]
KKKKKQKKKKEEGRIVVNPQGMSTLLKIVDGKFLPCVALVVLVFYYTFFYFLLHKRRSRGDV